MIVIPTVDSADPTHETWQFDFLDDGILSGSSTSPLVTDLPVAITIDHFDFDGITNRQPLTGQATISLVDPTFTTVGQFIINVQRIGDQFIFDPFTLDALGFPDVSNVVAVDIQFETTQSTIPEPTSTALFALPMLALHLRRTARRRGRSVTC